MDLKKFLKETRVSQVELSQLFGCGPANVSNIVNGKRNLTEAQLRRLVDEYGFDVVSEYADPSELAFLRPVPSGGGPVVEGSSNVQVQSGDNNRITTDAALVAVMKQQSDQISALIAQQHLLLEQQSRLVSLLEKEKK